MNRYIIRKKDPNYNGKSTMLGYEENSIYGKDHKYKNKKEAYKDYPKEHYVVQYIHPDGSYGFKRKHKEISFNFTHGVLKVSDPELAEIMRSSMVCKKNKNIKLSDIITPNKFRKLADFIDEIDKDLGLPKTETNVQDDLRKFADALEKMEGNE